MAFIAAAMLMTWITQRQLDMKKGLSSTQQVLNCVVSFLPLVLPLWSSKTPIQRLISVCMGWAPFYILMSISYEVLFYACLTLAMVLWLILESVFHELQLDNSDAQAEMRIGFFFLLFI